MYMMKKYEIKEIIEKGLEDVYATPIELPDNLLDKIYNQYSHLWDVYTVGYAFEHKIPAKFSFEDCGLLLESLKTQKIVENPDLNIECCFYIALRMCKQPYYKCIDHYNGRLLEKMDLDDIRYNDLNYFLDKKQQFIDVMQTKAFEQDSNRFSLQVRKNVVPIESLYRNINFTIFEMYADSQIKKLSIKK